jgi:hypothetical protein
VRLYPINRQTSKNPVFDFQRDSDPRFALSQQSECWFNG